MIGPPRSRSESRCIGRLVPTASGSRNGQRTGRPTVPAARSVSAFVPDQVDAVFLQLIHGGGWIIGEP